MARADLHRQLFEPRETATGVSFVDVARFILGEERERHNPAAPASSLVEAFYQLGIAVRWEEG